MYVVFLVFSPHFLYAVCEIFHNEPKHYSSHLWFCSKVTFHEKHPVKLGTKGPQRIQMQKLCNLLTNFARCYLLTTQRKCCLFKTHFRTLFTESEWTNGPMSQAVVTSPMRPADCCGAWHRVTPIPVTTRHFCKQLCRLVCVCVCFLVFSWRNYWQYFFRAEYS